MQTCIQDDDRICMSEPPQDCQNCPIAGYNKHICGYSNCFRPASKKRGFLYCCDYHLKHKEKWGKDGMTFTGSKFERKTFQDMSLEEQDDFWDDLRRS